MAERFGHERLKVYQKGMQFASMCKTLLDVLPRRVAACDHLDRGAESILLNIAHASSSWAPKERIVYLGNASGFALECAACLDIFVARALVAGKDMYPGKSLLSEIVSMLVSMRQTTADRVREDHAPYRTKAGNLFSHEGLDVYQTELRLIYWLDRMPCSDNSQRRSGMTSSSHTSSHASSHASSSTLRPTLRRLSLFGVFSMAALPALSKVFILDTQGT